MSCRSDQQKPPSAVKRLILPILLGGALLLNSGPAAADCPDPEILGDVLALVAEANPVLSAERDQFEEQARQRSWESYLSLGYATNTTFESGEAGGSAGPISRNRQAL